MAQTKQKKQLTVSPKGIAMFSHLSKPDTEGDYADGKYKVTIVFPKEGAENQEQIDTFLDSIREAHDAARGKKKTECPVKDGDEKDNEAYHGKWSITAKTQYAPDLRDAKKTKLEPEQAPRSGDEIKIAFYIHPYDKGKNAGVSLQLAAVQLLKKNSGGGSNAGSAFDEEEGFEAAPGVEKADGEAPDNDDDI